MNQDKTWLDATLAALAEEIRMRMQTPRSEFVDQDKVFSAARAVIEASRNR